MSWPRIVCVSLACLGLILPGSALEGSQAAERSPAAVSAYDVKLDPRGRLWGFVVDADGIPVAGTSIVVRQIGREVARTSSDARGRFSIAGLRGGTYQVVTGPYEIRLRAWTARTAPPHAKPTARIIIGGKVVRGQRPLKEFLTSDAVIMTGLIGAMIAVPIAVYQARHRTPGSP